MNFQILRDVISIHDIPSTKISFVVKGAFYENKANLDMISCLNVSDVTIDATLHVNDNYKVRCDGWTLFQDLQYAQALEVVQTMHVLNLTMT